jgi:hypothetical protein
MNKWTKNFWLIVTPILIGISILSLGCTDYNYAKQKCMEICRTKQKDNVGAKFMWSDIDRTFGKCTCVSKQGYIDKIYIKTGPK